MPTQSFFDQNPPFPVGLPVLDLPRISYQKLYSNDAHESQALLDACCDYGFFLLDLTQGASEGKLLDDVESAFGIGRSFFDSDLETKKEFVLHPNQVGYKPIGALKIPGGKTDLTEMCNVSKDSILNKEPAIPKAFAEKKPLMISIVDGLHEVALQILRHLAQHLQVDMATFDQLHDPHRPSVTVLRFLHNPAQKSGSERQASLMGHTDNGTLTILFTAIGGLQVLPPDLDDSPANWRWVQPQPGCAIVNVGDSLVQWTGGIVRSAFHRVLYAPGAQASCERYSFGYFLKPAEDSSMRRIQQGRVPQLNADEVETDRQIPNYQAWHLEKSRGVDKGLNIAFRGGLGFRHETKAAA